MRLRLSLFLLFGAFYTGFSQSCDALIAEDKIIGGAHLLRSHPATLVVRGSYTYSLELMSSDKGITAKIYSKGGVEFNQDDELIFMDINQNRRSFRFVEMGEMNMDRGTPIHMNVVQLDLKAVQWFATSDLLVLYIKNNINKEMRKFTVNTSRQQEFRQLAVCFNEKLDKSKVVDVELPENPAPKSDPSKPVSATTSSTPTAAKRNVDPSQMTDEELADLRRELQVGDHRFQVQYRDRIAVMCGATQRLQYQLQAVGIAVAGDLTLVQLELVQYCLQPLLAHAVPGDLFDHAQYQCFQRVSVLGLTALDTAAEHHFTHGVFQAAQRRW